MAIIAIALSVATILLFMKSLQVLPSRAKFPYLIAYISDRSGAYRIHICDLEGREIPSPMEFQPGDVLPVCEHLPPKSDRKPRIAFIRFETTPGTMSSTEVGTPGSVYVVAYGESQATKVSGKVPRILPIVPAWSPDGKELAFAGVEDLNGDGKFTKEEAGIYVCNVERGGARRVATVYPLGWHLCWSPKDSLLILQIEKANVPVPVAHVLDLTNGQLIARDDATIAACWSPDGQFIALYSIADRKIHILNRDGVEQYTMSAPGGVVVDLQWLPARSDADAADTGYLLAMSAQNPGTSAGQLHLRAASPSSSQSWKLLTDAQSSAAYPAPSPDGRYLAYTLMVTHMNPRGGPPAVDADLYVLELGEDEPHRLTTDPGFEGFPTWIPVGK